MVGQAFRPHLSTAHVGADTQSPTQGSLTRAVVAGRQDETGTTGAVVAAVDVVTVVLTPPVVYGTLVDVCNGISSISYTSENNPNQIQHGYLPRINIQMASRLLAYRRSNVIKVLSFYVLCF